MNWLRGELELHFFVSFIEDNRSESLIFLDESVCWLVSKYTQFRLTVVISICENSHKTICMDRGCHTVVIHKTQATYMHTNQ